MTAMRAVQEEFSPTTNVELSKEEVLVLASRLIAEVSLLTALPNVSQGSLRITAERLKDATWQLEKYVVALMAVEGEKR